MTESPEKTIVIVEDEQDAAEMFAEMGVAKFMG
jgi:hypothetical protein